MGIKLMQEEMISRVGKGKLRMKRVIIAGAIGASIVVSGLWMGFNAMADLLNPAREDGTTAESLDQIGDLQTKETFGEFDVNVEWDDDRVRHVIHAMSHQKVEADRKWTSIQITQDRLVTLANIIEQNKNILEDYDLYSEIVYKWIDGDFSEVDQDHNAIWYLQDGTIGKATGIMSPEEEKEFIQDVFE